jgi:hypothetical protein
MGIMARWKRITWKVLMRVSIRSYTNPNGTKDIVLLRNGRMADQKFVRNPGHHRRGVRHRHPLFYCSHGETNCVGWYTRHYGETSLYRG